MAASRQLTPHRNQQKLAKSLTIVKPFAILRRVGRLQKARHDPAPEAPGTAVRPQGWDATRAMGTEDISIAQGVVVGPTRPLLVIAGPCVIESEALCVDVAGAAAEVCRRLGLPYVFKASFDKATRTSISSFRGPGLEAGLEVLAGVKRQVGVPVLTDIHHPAQAEAAARVVDVLQVPAFLCRQTDLVVAAAETGLPVHVKKAQFMSPADMGNVVEKIHSRGNRRVLLCERGTAFGYNNLVVDFRSIPAMRALGCPVIYDVTHSVMRPGGLGGRSGGDREMAPPLAAAAVAAGADGLFIETHPQPEKGLSDAATMLPLCTLEPLLERLQSIAAAAAGRHP